MLIRANADTTEQAIAARRAGMLGVGICRTEPMLSASGRLELMRTIAAASSPSIRNRALDLLLPLHQASLEGVFHATSPYPVFVRLLDSPLQRFLPSPEQVDAELSNALSDEDWDGVFAIRNVRQHHTGLPTANPALGLRGCRLSLIHPEILAMQIAAILKAALCLAEQDAPLEVGILIPLVSSEEEMRVIADAVRRIAAGVFEHHGRSVPYKLGVLIELPRAAICAGDIARHVDFVCFGTNHLTQMTYGFAKEEASEYLRCYVAQGIFREDPFVTLDRSAVGHLLHVAVQGIRQNYPSMEIGVCGDHCGDPEALQFFHSLGVDFISCAPANAVDVTRLAERATRQPRDNPPENN
jgi:pyruvate,orthophosphate dikinase